MATWILVNTGSGNGLLPDGTKPLPEPVLTYHDNDNDNEYVLLPCSIYKYNITNIHIRNIFCNIWNKIHWKIMHGKMGSKPWLMCPNICYTSKNQRVLGEKVQCSLYSFLSTPALLQAINSIQITLEWNFQNLPTYIHMHIYIYIRIHKRICISLLTYICTYIYLYI